MLDAIAGEARRWTNGMRVEMALVAPICRGVVQPMVAVALGTARLVHAEPAVIFRVALSSGADEIVLVHNHPAGSPASAEDLALTRRLVALGAALGLPLRAHLVTTAYGWYDCLDRTGRLTAWPPPGTERADAIRSRPHVRRTA